MPSSVYTMNSSARTPMMVPNGKTHSKSQYASGLDEYSSLFAPGSSRFWQYSLRLDHEMPLPSSAAIPKSMDPFASGSGGSRVKMAVTMGRLPMYSGVYG